MTAAFYFVRFHVPGQEPRGSQTFRLADAARRYANRVRLEHPDWRVVVIRYQGGEQTEVPH